MKAHLIVATFSLVLGAFTAGCSSSNSTGPGPSPSDDAGAGDASSVDSGADAQFVNKCVAAGGRCAAVVPNACPTGFSEADYSQYPCEPPGYAGVTCCLPTADGGPSTDAGPRGDGGTLCTDDAGAYPGSPGTCNGQTCSPGCACVAQGGGGAACLCTGALPPDGGSSCISPTCGTIFCHQGCTCTDSATGACHCP